MITCAPQGYLPDPVRCWLILIFTAAIFIPNTWRRATAVIVPLAAAPVVLTVVMGLVDDPCRDVMQKDEGYLSLTLLFMSLASVTAIWGVHTIGALRREAFEARQLGQYHLCERIGGGGMGEVFLAEHQLLKRPCAIKLIHPEQAGDPRALARFEREVRASAQLSHWNNIDIFDYGHADDGTFYYVMEYLPGLNLAELVQQAGPLPTERVIYLLRQICDALEEAHGKGLLHRDIKPANIFAAQRGGRFDVAKLLDFGLVKPLTGTESTNLTREGSITGSPLYMCPEQVVGDEPDERGDIYSLGAVAYFLLTGQPPFEHNRPMKVMMAHVNEAPVSLSDLGVEIPDDVEGVVMRCLAKDPEDRYPTATALSQALDKCALADGWNEQRAAQWWEEHRVAQDVSSTENSSLHVPTG